MSIKFVVSTYRKKVDSKFDSTLSHYWKQVYKDVFRRWKDE